MMRTKSIVTSAVFAATTFAAFALGPLAYQTTLTPGDTSFGNGFGRTVALSGNTIVVGASEDNGVNFYAGAAYVYVQENGVWSQQAKLYAPDPDFYDNFGVSVAIDGDTLVIGAPNHGHNYNLTGAAFVFVRQGTTWTLQQELQPSDGVPYYQFGESVSISGDTVAVGSTLGIDPNSNAGSVYVYVRSGSSWSEQQRLGAADAVNGELAGYSLALKGDTLVTGAPYANNSTGVAHVFERSGTTWSQAATLAAADGFWSDMFGCSVAVDGNRIIVGSRGHDAAGDSTGAAYVFAKDGTWNLDSKLLPGDPYPGREFGIAVALSGSMAVVGADQEYDGYNFTVREAYVFSRETAGWAESSRPVPTGELAGQHTFGASVAAQPGLVAIGDSSYVGAIYVYQAAANTPPEIVASASPATLTCMTNGTPITASVIVRDADNNALTVVWSANGTPFHTETVPAGQTISNVTLTCPAVALPLGTNIIETTVNDGTETASSTQIVILVGDTTAPVISGVTASPSLLQPARRQMVPVTISVAAADDCGVVSSRITGVTFTDAPPKGKKIEPAYQITGDLTVDLRAEKYSTKQSRVYTVTVATTDAAGNTTAGSVTVTVP